MKDKLKESENDHETYENFDTDDDTPKVKKKNTKYLFPIILFTEISSTLSKSISSILSTSYLFNKYNSRLLLFIFIFTFSQ